MMKRDEILKKSGVRSPKPEAAGLEKLLSGRVNPQQGSQYFQQGRVTMLQGSKNTPSGKGINLLMINDYLLFPENKKHRIRNTESGSPRKPHRGDILVAQGNALGKQTPTNPAPSFSAPALATREMWLKPVLITAADSWLKPTEIKEKKQFFIYQRLSLFARRGTGEGPVVHNRAQAVRACLLPLLQREQLGEQACLLPLLPTLTKMPYAFYRHGLQTPATDASAFFVVRYFNN